MAVFGLKNFIHVMHEACYWIDLKMFQGRLFNPGLNSFTNYGGFIYLEFCLNALFEGHYYAGCCSNAFYTSRISNSQALAVFKIALVFESLQFISKTFLNVYFHTCTVLPL